MGRARIQSLLVQLEANQERERVVDAAIFATAQTAVNLLRQAEALEDQTRQLPEG